MLERGVAERIADVRSPAGVFALCAIPTQAPDVLDNGDLWLVLPSINDPGNLGTMMRAAEAAGASGIALGAGSVDVYNPKVVRASAGAVTSIAVVEGNIIAMLEQLANRQVGALTRWAASSHHDTPAVALDEASFLQPTAFVLGHETRGLGAVPIDASVSIPMAGAVESLNVAMAATVLLFEAARQRGYGAARKGLT